MANSDNSYATSLRLSPELKDGLRQAAERSGRSLSAEMTARLERSVYDDQTAPHLSSPIMRMIAGAIAQAELARGSHWYEDPETADLCRDAVNGILGLFMPISPARLRKILEERERGGETSMGVASQWGREFAPVVEVALREAYVDNGAPEAAAIKAFLADSPLKADPWMLDGDPFRSGRKPAKKENKKTK